MWAHGFTRVPEEIEVGVLERIFGRQAQTRVLQFLLENRGKMFNLSDIAENVGVSPSTVSRVIEKLIEAGIVEEVARWRQMRVVKLNEKNVRTNVLIRFLEEIKRV